MNFAELPLALLAKRAPTALHTIEYQGQDFHPRTGKPVQRKVTISGAGKYGLPTAQDEEVLIGLIYLTLENRLENGFEDGDDRTVNFTRRQLFQILGWPDTGDYYERLKKSLRRWKGVTIVYENWWDESVGNFNTEETGFGILENYQLADGRRKEKTQLRLPLADSQSQRSHCSITWNKTPFASFRSGYVKRLNIDTFFRLPTPAAKRAFRYLDKHLPSFGAQEFDLQTFACQHVGLSSNYKPSRLRSEVQKSVVKPLEEANVIEPLAPTRRFPKRDGRIRVLFSRGPAAQLSPTAKQAAALPDALLPTTPVASPLIAELCRRGLGGKAARDFLAAHPAAYIEAKIDYLDFLTESGEGPKKPAGWLRRAIEEDYGPPPGYMSKTDRERIKNEQAERQRQREVVRQQAENAERKKREEEENAKKARRDHIESNLSNLSPAEREQLENNALAKATGFDRDFLNGKGPAAGAIRQRLIDEEVLSRHPLP
jgi:Replication initiator protein A